MLEFLLVVLTWNIECGHVHVMSSIRGTDRDGELVVGGVESDPPPTSCVRARLLPVRCLPACLIRPRHRPCCPPY